MLPQRCRPGCDRPGVREVRPPRNRCAARPAHHRPRRSRSPPHRQSGRRSAGRERHRGADVVRVRRRAQFAHGAAEREPGRGSGPTDPRMTDTPTNGEPSVRIEQVSLVDQAAEKIRELMLAGVITPGSAVREEWLHSRLGISRPPIREAMQMLVQQGLLGGLPRRGVRALELTQTDVWEIYSLRGVLDQFALKLAVPVKDRALLTPMHTAIDDMRAASSAGDHPKYVQANRDFHVALIALAGNGRLLGIYEI